MQMARRQPSLEDDDEKKTRIDRQTETVKGSRQTGRGEEIQIMAARLRQYLPARVSPEYSPPFCHMLNPVERVDSQPENPFALLIANQHYAVVPEFTLESGVTLYNVPVAYTVRGQLSPAGDNALVICHALSGSADVADWWGPLLGGPGQAFDVSRFFVVCLNSLGSPYGSASAVTYKDGDPSKGLYGPEFPLTTIRDDVK